jgi:hypothetical protein
VVALARGGGGWGGSTAPNTAIRAASRNAFGWVIGSASGYCQQRNGFHVGPSLSLFLLIFFGWVHETVTRFHFLYSHVIVHIMVHQ